MLIARDAAEGLTLVQLADYATIRTLIGMSDLPDSGRTSIQTILSFIEDENPPQELFDTALVAELDNASQNSSARRVDNDRAAAALRSEIRSSREE